MYCMTQYMYNVHVHVQMSAYCSLQCDLASFLIRRSCEDSMLANFFTWYLTAECVDETTRTRDARVHRMFQSVLLRFSDAMTAVSE